MEPLPYYYGVELLQKLEKRATEKRVYKNFERIHISPDSGKQDALDRGVVDKIGYIKNGFIYTNFSSGQLFISYQGALEDDNGNLFT